MYLLESGKLYSHIKRMNESYSNIENYIALFQKREIRRRNPEISKGWGQITALLSI